MPAHRFSVRLTILSALDLLLRLTPVICNCARDNRGPNLEQEMLYITFTKHDGSKVYDVSHDGKSPELLKTQLQRAIELGNAGNIHHKSMAEYKAVDVE